MGEIGMLVRPAKHTIPALALAAIAFSAASHTGAAPKPGWSCSYAENRLLLTHPMVEDTQLTPALKAKTTGVTMKGNPTLVISHMFQGDGRPTMYNDGRHSHTIYIRDGNFTLDGGNGAIKLDQLLVDRLKPNGRREGMFAKPRPITDDLGREISTDIHDLFAGEVDSLRFEAKLPDVFVTWRFYLTVPGAGFDEALARGLKKTQTAKGSALKPC
jgi:hypothetical protein